MKSFIPSRALGIGTEVFLFLRLAQTYDSYRFQFYLIGGWQGNQYNCIPVVFNFRPKGAL